MASLDNNKVALITGSSDGIGRGIALYLAKRSVSVIVNGRKEEKVDKVVNEILSIGGIAYGVTSGVDTIDGVENLINTSVNKFGKIDYLINNAGVNRQLHVKNIEEKDWDAVINTNLKGTFYCNKFVQPIMERNGGGSIVNISSVQGKVTKSRRSVYAASKAGIDGLTRSLAVEWAKYNIRVNAVAPGLILTKLIQKGDFEQSIEELAETVPLGRLGTPEDIAEVVYFLCSQGSYITGQVIYVDGGRSSASIN